MLDETRSLAHEQAGLISLRAWRLSDEMLGKRVAEVAERQRAVVRLVEMWRQVLLPGSVTHVTGRGSYTFVRAGLSILPVLFGLLGILVPGPGQDALACPGALFVNQLSPPIAGQRAGFRLFVKDGFGQGPGWQAIPIQVDPVDEDGHLKFFEDDAYLKQNAESTDFMTFRPETFGERLDKKRDKLPCQGEHVYELTDPTKKRYAYLTSCGAKATPVKHAPAVSFDRSGHRLESEGYRYRFNPKNYMQFDEIGFRNAMGLFEPVALDSRLMIRADVRKFFTMHFDSDEIESQLEASRLGPVGDLARLSFFLKILVFKIKMSLSTDVGFFSDSGHIPMMVSLPVNAHDYLHPKSGILYSWKLGPTATKAPKVVDMPLLDPAETKKGFEHLASIGRKFCKGTYCDYRYTVEIDSRRLSMDLGIKRELVNRGFFPIYVDDVAKYREAMGWEIDKKDAEGRVGMYFEVSGLPKGGHPWDFWLRLGSSGERSKQCPAWVRVATVQPGK